MRVTQRARKRYHHQHSQDRDAFFIYENCSPEEKKEIMRQGVEEEGALSGVQDISTLKPCHGKYGSAPLSGVTDPYSRSLYIGCFLPTNLQLMDERQKHSTFATDCTSYLRTIRRLTTKNPTPAAKPCRSSCDCCHYLVCRQPILAVIFQRAVLCSGCG